MLTIYGARGSHPVSGELFRRYGGSTSCFCMETPTGILVIDAGTGIGPLGDTLNARQTLPPVTILFTHFHLDHIIGLPSFKPFLRQDAEVILGADPVRFRNWRSSLMTIMDRPFWPFRLLGSAAKIRLEDLPGRRPAAIMGPVNVHGVDVSWCPASHPQGCVSYRLTYQGRSVVIGTDLEHGDAKLDALFEEFCRGADVVIHDAQYTPEEYPSRAGWGHSTWQRASTLAASLGVKQLILTSHDPARSDQEVDHLVERARELFARTVAASEQMVVLDSPAAQPAAAGPTPQRLVISPASEAAVSREDQPLTFRYTFRFDNGQEKTAVVRLDPKTFQLQQPPQATYPMWTALPHCKCSNCPLREEDHATCPAATSLAEVVKYFGRSLSTESVHVTIDGEARTYVKRAPLPEAVSSLMGLLMVTSGCPVMAKLRPMVRYHLPFSTLEETKYRVLSMYLLAQFFAEQHGRSPDWELAKLPKLYEEIRQVNSEFFKRLTELGIEDASLNAIVRLDTFADSIAFSIDRQVIDDLENTFLAYLPPDAGDPGGPARRDGQGSPGHTGDTAPAAPPLRFRYVFRFADADERSVELVLDARTLEMLQPQRTTEPDHPSLGFCQSERCPRYSRERPTCPAVTNLEDIVRLFHGRPAQEPVEVSIETEARTYVKRTTLQQAVTSLLGIFMVTSGCSVLGKLKPMVRYHLPFATLEETQYRALSMYLLAQYVVARKGGTPDWKLRDLLQMYREIQDVNQHFAKRLAHMDRKDPSINALVILEAFSYAIAFSIDRNLLDEIEMLFRAYDEESA